MKVTIVQINNITNWLFEKIKKIDKLLAKKKKSGGGNLINKIRNEKEEVTTDNKEIQSIIREYYEQQSSFKSFSHVQTFATT